MIEVSIKTRKRLCIGLYKPPSQHENYLLDYVSLVINRLTCQLQEIRKYLFKNVLEIRILDHRSFTITSLKSQVVKETQKQDYIVITVNLIWIILKQS